jgi:hypothetical protein
MGGGWWWGGYMLQTSVGWLHVANECGFDKSKPMHLPALASLLTHTNKHSRKKKNIGESIASTS